MEAKFLGLDLKSNLFLAPLAGVSDSSYRYLCHREGAGLSYTEMVSAKGLYYKSPGTEELLTIRPDEGPVAIQLFGSEPEMLDFAIRKLADRNNVLFDINMGCPVPKVVKNHEGSSLLADSDLAARIVEASVKASNDTSKKPITVKMRIGFGEYSDYLGFAKKIEAAGAAAITVHGRTREQYYSGQANWNAIKEIKEALSIPVIGNGDIRSLSDWGEKQKLSDCEFAMVGRGSMGNPWVFSGREKDPNILGEHFEMLLSSKGEKRACLEMRKYFAWYTKGVKGAAELRQKVNTAEKPEEIKRLINELISYKE